MGQSASIWLVILVGFAAANLPFLSDRVFGLLPLPGGKGVPLRLLELLVLYLLVGLLGRLLEGRLGQVAPQGWEFYAITLALFLTLAFPGFIWRYLWRPRTEKAMDKDPDAHLVEQATDREQLLRGHFLQVVRDTVRLPDGGSASREFVQHPGAVMVIALTDDGQVLLERQYRHPVGQVMVEFPAGKLDAGEGGLACAQRELREETGYSAREWARAGQLHPCIGYSDEFIEIWFARGLSAGAPRLDAEEFLEVFSADPAQLMARCCEGRVTDGKTLAGVLWLNQVLAGTWVLDWQAESSSS